MVMKWRLLIISWRWLLVVVIDEDEVVGRTGGEAGVVMVVMLVADKGGDDGCGCRVRSWVAWGNKETQGVLGDQRTYLGVPLK